MIPALQACKFIEENLSMRVETLGKETLINCAKTAMSSKIVIRKRLLLTTGSRCSDCCQNRAQR